MITLYIMVSYFIPKSNKFASANNINNSCVSTTTQTDFKSVTNHFILFTLQAVYIENAYIQLTLRCELNRFTLIHFSHVSKIKHGEFSCSLDRSRNKGAS